MLILFRQKCIGVIKIIEFLFSKSHGVGFHFTMSLYKTYMVVNGGVFTSTPKKKHRNQNATPVQICNNPLLKVFTL